MNARHSLPLLVSLLAVALAPAQTNLREFGITLRSRPAGSASSTPYSSVSSVGTPNFGGTWIGQPGNLPFPPFAASGSWQLSPASEYQVEFRSICLSSADFAPNVSLGQRMSLQMNADFGAAAAVSWMSIAHFHQTVAGTLFPPGTLFHQYSSFGAVLPWQDSSTGAAGGNSVDAATSIAFVATSGTTAALRLLATAEVGSYQGAITLPGPIPAVAAHETHSTITFSVSQATTLTMDVAASGEVRGETQDFPLLPIVFPALFFGATGRWFDPPLALGFDLQQTGTSLFTDILALPVGVDGDGFFEVLVGSQSLGRFAAGSRVDFRQILGGNGVPAFRIVGIDPAVDATDSAVFPVKLAFDTPTAEFTMTPVLWRKIGTSCSEAVCAQCPNTALAPIGDALEGNLSFGVGITNGPTNGVAGFFVGLGPAAAVPFPVSCGSTVLPLQSAVFSIGVATLSGTGTCDGAGSIPVPLVPVPPLFGLFLTMQAVTLCPAGGFGLTHAIEFAIGN